MVSPVGGRGPGETDENDGLVRLTAADFDIDVTARRAAVCPAGHEAVSEYEDEEARERVEMHFAREVCESCKLRSRCPVRWRRRPELGGEWSPSGAYVLSADLARVNIGRRRRAESDGQWRRRYGLRAGIEGTNSELKRRHGLGRLRVRGGERVRLAVYLKALACNVKRMVRARLDEMNVWVAPVDAVEEARPVTEDNGRGIRIHFWTYNPSYITYLQDRDGDENWHVYAVNVETGESRDLTPYDGVQAIPKENSPKFPDEVLIAINHRDPQLHDLYRVNILTGESELIVTNDFGSVSIMSDQDFKPRLAAVLTPDGGSKVLALSESEEWEMTMRIDAEDDLTTWPLYFDVDSHTLYMFDSRGRDTSALMAVDMETGETEELAVDARVDVEDTIEHPVTGRPQAVGFEHDRFVWKILDDSIAADIERIDDKDRGEFAVRSRTLDDQKWLIEYVRDDGPKTFHLYERETAELKYLFSDRPELESAPLAPMHSAIVNSRDGLDLMVYYTLPVESTDDDSERPSRPLPMVLRVHGGPTRRDSWGYDAEHQLLANRGYAVLSVNFRGSTGFGKGFINAANLEWGGAMHDDLIDAVEWAVEKGIAESDQVAILGASYGGYAVLVGLTFTPGVFACGVDLVGISNLNTFMDNAPPYWMPFMTFLRTRVADNTTEEGRRLLAERSPMSRVDSIVRPLLIGQGANDPRVKQAESDQIVNAMKERGIPVTYLLYPDEGHGFARPENNLSYMAVAEAFLAKHLGGRFEPIGDDFQGSSIQVLAGADHVPGLAAKLTLAPGEMSSNG